MTRDDLIKILGEWVRVTNPHAPVTWTGQLVGLADDPSLLLRIGPGQQATLPQRFDVEHLELDPANAADDEHGKPLHCRDCAQAWLDGKPTPPQDGPHAPQDGPQRPDAGAETSDGAGGRQTGADGRETLREQYAAALWQAAEFNTIAEWICCEPLNPQHELCAQGYAAMRMIKALIVDDPEAYKPAPLADAVLAVRDRRMEQLAAGRATWKSKAEEIERDRDQLAATHIRDQSALAQIRLHIAAHRPRLQYADPILLARVDAVLRQVGELEAAGGGEGA